MHLKHTWKVSLLELPCLVALFVLSNTLELHPKITSTSCKPAFNHKRPSLAPYLDSANDVARHICASLLSSQDNRRKLPLIVCILIGWNPMFHEGVMSNLDHVQAFTVQLYFWPRKLHLWSLYVNSFFGYTAEKFFHLLCCENMGVENMVG